MSRHRLSVLSAALVGALASASLAQTPPPAAAPPPPAPADWGKALAEDARAFHDIVAESHPGPVDVENPGFKAVLKGGLTTALKRAKTAKRYEDWYFALNEYQASFNDGHLTLYEHAPMGHAWRSRWPGFLTALEGGRYVVAFNRDPAAPPVGAVLTSCDGRPADAFAADFIGKGAGRWNLRSRRVTYASSLFVDQMNPYVRRPERCVFQVDGAERTYPLAWRDLPTEVRDEGFAAARSPRYFAPLELRAYGADGYWVGWGSFESDPASDDGKALTALQARIESQADAIRASKVVVFDLRGNNGGSSEWSAAVTRILWGEAWVDAKAERSTGVDWRTSVNNIKAIAAYREQFVSDARLRTWFEELENGMKGARARGQALWRQGGGEASAAPKDAVTAMKARVYILTDYGCASACLDAVDLLKALGGVQVGQETSADTLYMDVREQFLPSMRAKVVVPMKVYRGRARGSNVTAVPAYEWKGALSDTAGVEAWIAGIDARR
ncbi:S41 family peptidase [Caulobacter mirabilis]|uniref:Uncharacterized protein n=1 Tax=Caulobacter mirabilis TaxID=69666 RepID=A0A2D2B265_9CAUL|nr:S41 family peptidase [Caulobacter mirabilis]ATQ44334.1 hypothetical protein CSW64_19040 [Caulobacter mirabilis]